MNYIDYLEAKAGEQASSVETAYPVFGLISDALRVLSASVRTMGAIGRIAEPTWTTNLAPNAHPSSFDDSTTRISVPLDGVMTTTDDQNVQVVDPMMAEAYKKLAVAQTSGVEYNHTVLVDAGIVLNPENN